MVSRLAPSPATRPNPAATPNAPVALPTPPPLPLPLPLPRRAAAPPPSRPSPPPAGPAAGPPSSPTARRGLLRAPAVVAGVVAAVLLACVAGVLLARSGRARSAAARGVALRIAAADAVESGPGAALARAFLEADGAASLRAVSPRPGALTVEGESPGGPETVAVLGGGVGAAFEALLSGAADVVVSPRRILPEERRRLATLGDMSSPACERVIGLGALAVIVSPANPVAQLDRQQLAALFGGAVSDWAELGVSGDEQAEWAAVGVPGKRGLATAGVNVYLQDGDAGVLDHLRGAVLGEGSLTPGARRLPTARAVAEAVAGDPGAIGVVPLGSAASARVVPVSDGAGPAVTPSFLTVATEEYLLAHRLYLYSAQATPRPAVARLVALASGAQGQAALLRAGQIDLAVKTDRPETPANAPPEYARLVAGAVRLTSVLRFEPGTGTLDQRAAADLDRVVAHLRAAGLDGRAVRVVGLAEAGSGKAGLERSRERAGLVVGALAQRGVTGVAAAGFGDVRPLSGGSDDVSRERSRRVEIWVQAR